MKKRKIHVDMYIYIHMNMYIYVHTYICIYTYIYKNMSLLSSLVSKFPVRTSCVCFLLLITNSATGYLAKQSGMVAIQLNGIIPGEVACRSIFFSCTSNTLLFQQ